MKSKTEINREYYLRNKAKILAKSKIKKSDPLKSEIKSKSLSTVLLAVLVIAMTLFLLRESAAFYSLTDKPTAYFRAGILEGAVLTFSLMKARTGGIGVLYRVMVILIYIYSLWVVSGSVIQSSFQTESKISYNQSLISDLKSEISKKTKLRDLYFETERVSLALKMDRLLEILKLKLEGVENLLTDHPNPKSSLFTLVAFRVLMMVSNLLFLKELSHRYYMGSSNTAV